ncbi:MAG: FAD-dependent thymidylate synthase [Candidatus Hodarchaeales archaeon]
MKIVKPGFEILTEIKGKNILKSIERAGRTCYKSEDKITDESCVKFVEMLIKRGHEAMIEHETLSVKIICDRGVSHEIVRHRLFSFAQESTRYVRYSGDMEFIRPLFFEGDSKGESLWINAMVNAESFYQRILDDGYRPEEARSVLPNSLKTEIVVTGNLREWRHFFKLRTAKAAHPQMREIAIPLLAELKSRIPVIFDDINNV